jgi:hypothetical protein
MSENHKQDRLIRLSINPTDEQIIDGIRQWLELLANDDYERAIQAITFHYAPNARWFSFSNSDLLW